MPGRAMDGRVVAQKIRSDVKKQVTIMKASKVDPNLATILVGDDPASKAYVRNKHTACAEVGIRSRNIELPANTSQQQLEKILADLGDDSSTTGILLQLPLPKGLDETSATTAIDVDKDVDGLNPSNLGLLFQRGTKIAPCTPHAVLALLKYYGVKIAGRHAVIINRTKLVGRPLSQLLLNEDVTVTICHSKTVGLSEIAKQADILLTGIGRRAEFTVGASMVKPEATVVDIGISSVNGKLVGDVDYPVVVQVASLISPVPGGVGPVTIAMLLYNTLLTACLQKGIKLDYTPDELGESEPI